MTVTAEAKVATALYFIVINFKMSVASSSAG